MVCAVGYVAGNAVVFFAGFAGSFGRIVVHGSLSFQSKNLKDGFVFSYVIVCPISLFYAIGAKILLGRCPNRKIPLSAEYITRAKREYHLGKTQISHFACGEIYHCNVVNDKLTAL